MPGLGAAPHFRRRQDMRWIDQLGVEIDAPRIVRPSEIAKRMVTRRILSGEAVAELLQYRDCVTSRPGWHQYIEIPHHAHRRVGIGPIEQREAALEQDGCNAAAR